MTKETKRFLKGLDLQHWKNRPIVAVALDIVGPLSEDKEKRQKWLDRIDKSAATRMRELAMKRGLGVYPEVLHIAVTGFNGTPTLQALEIAEDFAHRFVAAIK